MAHPFQSIAGVASECGSAPVTNLGNADPKKPRPTETLDVEAGPSKQSADTSFVDTGFATLPRLRRSPLSGGTYSEGDALRVLNSHFLIGKNNQQTGIFRINDDETLTFLPPEQFKLEVQNIFVARNIGGAIKRMPAEKFWKESPDRHQRQLVFKPSGTVYPFEFNLWRGYGVEPQKGWQKQRPLLRHIREVICRRDMEKFKYVIRLLAWMVQNPEKHSGVVLMLKSRKQGTGKSTLGKVMLDIFGQHGALIDDKDRLLGRFTDWLETKSFVLAEEILWAGDHKAADKFKSLVTGDTIQVERKFGGVWQIANRLKIIATTNHDHAIAAGVQDRRNVVLDVDDGRAGDKAWFDGLYRDLEDGGTSEFLGFLQRVKLGDWHPRQILKTAETAEQQRMSGDSVSQWSQACIEADAVIGTGKGSYGADTTHDLGQAIATDALRDAYTGFCRQNGLRPVSTDGFGRACTEMFGRRKRLPSAPSPTGKGKRRPWGYHVPKGNKWLEKVDARLGIQK
jgi:hypothetical protein